ncbi:MAG: mechanosensitive ion channel family protein, partial [Candidatus Bipolaricaulia bacterium]
IPLAGIYLAIARFILPEGALFYLGGLLKSFALFIWSWAVMRVILLLIQTMERRARGRDLLRRRFAPLFENLAKIVVFAVALIILLSIWGIPVTALLASAGLMGLIIGFAARDILANFFGGLFVLADSPYKIGDYIVLDSGERGMVTDIGLRSTRIKTKDDIEITIPNAQIANSKIINESGPQERTRVRVRVGVAYGSDVDRVKVVLTEVAEGNEHVCESPEPRVRFREFGDSSLNFELLCWIEDPINRGRVLDELNTAIYKRFAEEGIEIPFPQRDVYIKRFPKEG